MCAQIYARQVFIGVAEARVQSPFFDVADFYSHKCPTKPNHGFQHTTQTCRQTYSLHLGA